MISAQHCRKPELPGDNNVTVQITTLPSVASPASATPFSNDSNDPREGQAGSNHSNRTTWGLTSIDTQLSFIFFLYDYRGPYSPQKKRPGSGPLDDFKPFAKSFLLLPCYAHRETVLVHKEVLVLRRARHASLFLS